MKTPKHLILSLILPFACTSLLAKNLIINELDVVGPPAYDPQIKSPKLIIKNAKGTILNSDEEAPENWFNLSPADGAEGVRTEETYSKLGDAKDAKEIVVAVVDSGVDVNHQDLQGKIWINKNEIPNNKIDDDKNGYVDDVFGWNFIGGTKGQATIVADSSVANGFKLVKGDKNYQVKDDTLEMVRELVRMKQLKQKKEERGDSLSKKETAYLNELSERVSSETSDAKATFDIVSNYIKQFETSLATLRAAGFKDEATLENVSAFESTDANVIAAKKVLVQLLQRNLSLEKLNEYYEYYSSKLNTNLNENFNPRYIVGDNYDDGSEKYYGNNDVIGPDADHGTHVSGIIAANRVNDLGMKGVATHVKIMAVRVVPNGDERDKDVANGIRYAVDNGAKIINMSFGKSYSPGKKLVDEAVKYAERKGVLLVHAAGNDSHNNDLGGNFPNKKPSRGGIFSRKKDFKNWLEVGASFYQRGKHLPAEFSNYGKKTVDLFAPGVAIYSTTVGDHYASYQGTSMASPVVAGVAALVLSYKPELDANSLKDLLTETARRDVAPEKVLVPGTDETTADLVEFNTLSVTGGIVDAYSAASK